MTTLLLKDPDYLNAEIICASGDYFDINEKQSPAEVQPRIVVEGNYDIQFKALILSTLELNDVTI